MSPFGPIGPVAPCGPCGPVTPCGPVSPRSPGQPGAPGSPLGPIGPGIPFCIICSGILQEFGGCGISSDPVRHEDGVGFSATGGLLQQADGGFSGGVAIEFPGILRAAEEGGGVFGQ